MKTNRFKMYLTSEVMKEVEKGRLHMLINENDFLIKSLKKPGGLPKPD